MYTYKNRRVIAKFTKKKNKMKNYLKKRKKNKKKNDHQTDRRRRVEVFSHHHRPAFYIAPRPYIIFLVVDYPFGDCKCQRVKDTNSFLFRSLSILRDQKKRKPFWVGFCFYRPWEMVSCLFHWTLWRNVAGPMEWLNGPNQLPSSAHARYIIGRWYVFLSWTLFLFELKAIGLDICFLMFLLLLLLFVALGHNDFEHHIFRSVWIHSIFPTPSQQHITFYYRDNNVKES